MHRLYQVVGYMYNLDPDLLEAIATAESNGNPAAVSPKGAQGLMQLMPGTAQRYRVDHPFDPVDNVLGAARFLSYLRAWSQVQSPYSYNEIDLQAMIAAYNAGPRAVEKYGGIPAVRGNPSLCAQGFVALPLGPTRPARAHVPSALWPRRRAPPKPGRRRARSIA